MKMSDSFIVYRSFFESIREFDDKTRLAFYDALMKYGLDEVELPIKGVAKAIFTAVKPQIDANAKRRTNGNLGGRPKKEPMVFNENNHRFSETETNGYDLEKPNVNVNDNVNDNVNVIDNANDNVNANANDNVFPAESKKEGTNVPKKEIITALVAKWNSYADRGSIPTVRSVSVDSKTGKSVLARVEEHGLDEVVEVMDMVFQSNYLRGFKNGWCAKFDWMFLPSNYEKILNGNYKDRDVVQTQNDMIDQWAAEYHAREGEII